MAKLGIDILSGVSGLIGGAAGTKREQERADRRIRGLRSLISSGTADFEKDYYEDPMARAAAQRALTMTMNKLRQRNLAAAGTAAVMGSSEESIANEKAANAQVLSDMASQIAVAADEEKRKLKQQYKERDAKLKEALIEEQANKPTGLDVAANMIGGVAGGISKHYG